MQALNRIGKAQLELGKLKESKNSYTKALQIDPLNTIARRNLKELEQMKDEKTFQGKVQNKSNLEKLVRNDILIQTAARSAEFIIDKPNSLSLPLPECRICFYIIICDFNNMYRLGTVKYL